MPLLPLYQVVRIATNMMGYTCTWYSSVGVGMLLSPHYGGIPSVATFANTGNGNVAGRGEGQGLYYRFV